MSYCFWQLNLLLFGFQNDFKGDLDRVVFNDRANINWCTINRDSSKMSIHSCFLKAPPYVFILCHNISSR